MNINEFEKKYVTVITTGSGMKKKLISSDRTVLWEDIPSDRKVYRIKPIRDFPKREITPFPEILLSACICIYIGESPYDASFDTIIIPTSIDQMFISEYNDFFNQITTL